MRNKNFPPEETRKNRISGLFEFVKWFIKKKSNKKVFNT